MSRLIGLALQVVGALLLLLCVGTLAYAVARPQWVESQHDQPAVGEVALPAHLDAAPERVDSGTAESRPLAPTPFPATAPAVPAPDSAAMAALEDSGDAPAGATDALPADEEAADVAAAAPVSYGKAVRLQIPSIRVSSPVADVGLVNGEYQVPGWEVGHHADSPQPGEAGNSVLNGHLETINAGRVFARLKEVKAGDAVYVFTATHRLDWVVREVLTVPDTEYSFIQPSDDTRLTLYTCHGRYNPLTQGYTHWRVLVAELVAAQPLD